MIERVIALAALLQSLKLVQQLASLGQTEAHPEAVLFDSLFRGYPIGNIMIDHVSASWGLDENLSMYRHMYEPPDGGPAPGIAIAWAAALVLIVIVMALNLIARIIGKVFAPPSGR